MTHFIRTMVAIAAFVTSLVFVTAAYAAPHGGHGGPGWHGGGHPGWHGGRGGGRNYPVRPGYSYGYYPGYPYAYPGYPVYNVYPGYVAYPGYSYYNGVVCAAGNGYGYFWQAVGYQYYDAAQNALAMCSMYSPYCQVIGCQYR